MIEVCINLPEDAFRSIQRLAEREGVTISQFVASAASEKMAAFAKLDHLRREAAAGRREGFDHFLSAVPDELPLGTDRIVE